MCPTEREPDFLSRHFPTFLGASRRKRHYAGWLLEDRTIKLLKRIDADRSQRISASGSSEIGYAWLLPYRASFRRVISRGRVGLIKVYLFDCPPEMIPLCVWLWGECADRFRLCGLGSLRHHKSPRVRRSVAKALRRLEAWSLLNEMAATYPDDEKVQWFATAATLRRPFPDRLKNYKLNIDSSHAGEVATPSSMPYWARDKVWDYTPPKSVHLIRRMLHRIRHWVRWGLT
jgi:hypothetical protein